MLHELTFQTYLRTESSVADCNCILHASEDHGQIPWADSPKIKVMQCRSLDLALQTQKSPSQFKCPCVNITQHSPYHHDQVLRHPVLPGTPCSISSKDHGDSRNKTWASESHLRSNKCSIAFLFVDQWLQYRCLYVTPNLDGWGAHDRSIRDVVRCCEVLTYPPHGSH
jgi:hypothetical protein